MKSEIINKIAKSCFNIPSLYPFQELIIHTIIEQIENETNIPILSILPTGSGKSICFLLPSLLVKGISIIVYPIKALIYDQKRELEKRKIPSIIIEGGMTKAEIDRAFEALKTKKAKLVLTNVEMLSNYRISSRLRELHISLLVIDEVHTVISWGESFRPSYLKIGKIAEFLSAKQLIAFTATTDNHINERLKPVLFSNRDFHIIRGGTNRENLIFHTRETISKKAEIFDVLSDMKKLPAVVFTSSRTMCEKLSFEFKQIFNANYYHAGMEINERKKIEDWFYQSENGLLFATCAYGMGVNKKNIRTVIHYNLPNDIAMYLQESGRGGRDGKETDAYVLIKDDEKSELKNHFLDEGCIRRSLIQALGQNYGQSCTGCSHCLNERTDNYAFSQNLISYLKKHPLFLFKNHGINKLKKLLPFYTEAETKKLIGELIKKKIIKKRLVFLFFNEKS